jgi:chemotaxis protein MotB
MKIRLTASLIALTTVMAVAGCVSTKRFRASELKEADTAKRLADTQAELAARDADLAQTRSQLTQAQSERDGLQASNETLTKSMNAKKDELGKTVAQLTEQNTDLQQHMAALQQERDLIKIQKENEVKAMKATYDGLVGGLQKEIEDGQVKITQMEGKLSVDVADKIFFDSGRTQVKESGKQVLLRVGDVLKKLNGKQVRIQGHTDNVPIGGALKERFPTNWELSAARATEVVRFLQDTAGVPPDILSAAAFGPYRPVAPNDSEEGRAKNRRIEIAIVDKDAGQPIAK